MPHSIGQVYVHLIFSTKRCRPEGAQMKRIPFLTDQDSRRDLHGYMTGVLGNLGCPSLRIGGVEDHVHVLFRLSRVQPIVRVVEEVKRGSSTWVRSRGIDSFDWQDGYGAFSVSPQLVDRVIRYIENQEEYHRTETFANEYRGILQECGGLEHKVDIHLVFSTKNRFPFLADDDVRRLLHNRLATICENLGCPAVRVGGIQDHVHILYRLSPEQPLARVAQEVKKLSSRWLATRHQISNFDWQDGYGAFSVSPQHADWVIRYIENQEEHHRQETFADEYDRILRTLQPQSPG